MYLFISLYLYLVIILNTRVTYLQTRPLFTVAVSTNFFCCGMSLGSWFKICTFLIGNFPSMQMKLSVISGIKWYEWMFATVEKALLVRPGNSKLCHWCDFSNSCIKMIGECNMCIIVLSAELYWWWKLMPYLFSHRLSSGYIKINSAGVWWDNWSYILIHSSHSACILFCSDYVTCMYVSM